MAEYVISATDRMTKLSRATISPGTTCEEIENVLCGTLVAACERDGFTTSARLSPTIVESCATLAKGAKTSFDDIVCCLYCDSPPGAGTCCGLLKARGREFGPSFRANVLR